MDQEAQIRRAKAAEYLQQRLGAYTAETLAKLACVGGGPRFVKVGKFPLYRVSDLEEWIASRTSQRVANNAQLGVASKHRLPRESAQ